MVRLLLIDGKADPNACNNVRPHADVQLLGKALLDLCRPGATATHDGPPQGCPQRPNGSFRFAACAGSKRERGEPLRPVAVALRGRGRAPGCHRPDLAPRCRREFG